MPQNNNPIGGGTSDNPGGQNPGGPPEPLTNEELVQEAITRLSDNRPLTPAEARPIALLFKDLYKATVLNPGDELSFRLWRRLQRTVTSNWNRDDQILLKFCQRIINISPARNLEELERHQKAVQSLKDNDIPTSTHVQNEIAAERKRAQDEQAAIQRERERIARGEPKDPKDIPVSLESMAAQQQQEEDQGSPSIPPSRIDKGKRK